VNLQFRSRLEPPPQLVEQVEACDPTNAFHTSGYHERWRIYGRAGVLHWLLPRRRK
jgi:hypothetical protein